MWRRASAGREVNEEGIFFEAVGVRGGSSGEAVDEEAPLQQCYEGGEQVRL